MAIAYVTIGPVVTRNVFSGEDGRSETVTTSGTAALGTLFAGSGDVAAVFCVTPVYARSGNTASSTNAVYCPGGLVTYIGMTEGDRVSLIDA